MDRIQEATLYVRRSKFSNRTKIEEGDEETSTIEVRNFQTEPAIVELSAERVYNIGDYQSVRISVGFKIPCYVEEVASVHKELVQKLPKQVSKIFDNFCAEQNIKYTGA